MELKDFKCPKCGGRVSFNIEKQKMVCEFCNSEYENHEVLFNIENQEENPDQGLGAHVNKPDFSFEKPEKKIKTIETEDGLYQQETSEFSQEDQKKLNVYSCFSCGGEIIGDESMAATSCPYCGNNVVIPSKLSGDLKPDLIIPFKLDKEEAKSTLRNFYKGRKLLPKFFESDNNIEEIKGLYVPFWLFSGTSNGQISFTGTRIRTYSDGVYNYTETSYYDIDREGDLDFANVPVDGSSKIDDIFMESIEPFNWEEAVEFSSYYLPGFLADRYDIKAEDLVGIAESRIKETTLNTFRNSVSGYSSLTKNGESYKLGRVDVKYALAPVWFLNTKWEGNYYTFVMNGQTGKMIADDMPIDKSLKFRESLKAGLITAGGIFAAAMLAYPFIFG